MAPKNMAQYLLLLSIAAIVTGNATIEMPPRESVSATLSEVTELLEQGKIADGSKLPLTFLYYITHAIHLRAIILTLI